MDCLSGWKYGIIRFVHFLSFVQKISLCFIESDVQENQIGTKIVTRSLTNEFEPEDITDHYKNSSKSLDEKNYLARHSNDDVKIELKIPDDIKVRFYREENH